MIRTGDDVVSSSNGSFKITDVVEMDLSNTHVMKSYFLLEPITGNHAKVYIPLETAERRVRKAMEKKDAIRMIQEIENVDTLVIEDEKVRERKYKEVIQSNDPVGEVSLLKHLYDRRQERFAQGKKTTAVDDKDFKVAAHNLHAELAYALDCKEEEIPGIIQNYVKNKTLEI